MILIFGLIIIFSYQTMYGQECIKSFFNNVITFYVPCTNVEIDYCSVRGKRPQQQDAIAIHDKVINNNYEIGNESIIQNENALYSGIFDGHGY